MHLSSVTSFFNDYMNKNILRHYYICTASIIFLSTCALHLTSSFQTSFQDTVFHEACDTQNIE